MKIINLHFNSIHRGPGRVVENLARGLKKLGYDVYANDIPRKDVYQGFLQPTNMIQSLPRNALMGPNLFVLPSEWGEICQRFDHYVTPSSWVSQVYRKYDNLKHATIDCWPVGIDTDLWSNVQDPLRSKTLVYFKNRSEEDLKELTDTLDRIAQPYDLIRYGSYEESNLRQKILECNSCILLTNTESQGIAYMQIMSSGLPCYVINKDTFEYENITHPATSVPYFDDRCGIVEQTFSVERWCEFNEKLGSYKPSDYVNENFSLTKCAQNYLDLMEKYK